MNEISKLKENICEIGRRIYAKDFAAANEGNLSIRADEDRVICTPTLQCKGFMQPDDLCTVDMEGKQIAGDRKRTSEVLLHLEIYRRRPDVRSIVHCHPPHVTAFAVAREPIPQCVLPEPDIFLGEVPIAPYETPGGQEFADTIAPFVQSTNVIILANHGTVSYDADIERAYWLTEILDAYCRILILAKQLGGIHYLPLEKGHELLELRRAWGFSDPRLSKTKSDCDVCGHDSFKSTWDKSQVAKRAFPDHPSAGPSSSSAAEELSELIELITERVVSRLSAKRG